MLGLEGTKVADLAPIESAKLKKLYLNDTPVSDLGVSVTRITRGGGPPTIHRARTDATGVARFAELEPGGIFVRADQHTEAPAHTEIVAGQTH